MIPVPLPEKVMKKKVQEKLLNSLYACPHGVISWSRVMDDLVETSTNLASIKFEGMNRIVISTSQRSSVNSAKMQIANTVSSTFKLAGAMVEQTEGYPGWNPNPDSAILKITEASYKRLFGIDPAVKAIHAGLECGLFLEKYPYLDMISFGPTILDPHSPSERISIKTTEKFWLLLLDVLKNIPQTDLYYLGTVIIQQVQNQILKHHKQDIPSHPVYPQTGYPGNSAIGISFNRIIYITANGAFVFFHFDQFYLKSKNIYSKFIAQNQASLSKSQNYEFIIILF